jgi:hypothetical protein
MLKTLLRIQKADMPRSLVIPLVSEGRKGIQN